MVSQMAKSLLSTHKKLVMIKKNDFTDNVSWGTVCL